MKNKAQLRPYIVSIIVIVLFAFFLFSFIITFLNKQNPNSELLQDKYGLNSSVSSINKNLNSFKVMAGEVNSTLSESQPSATDYLFLIFKGAFTIPLKFLSFGVSGIGLITSLIFPELSKTQFGSILIVVMSVISSVMIITIVFFIIKAIRSGETER